MRTLILFTIGLLLLAGKVEAQASSVTLAWNASPSPGVTNYWVYWGTNSNLSYPNRVSAGTNLTLVVGGLSPGTYHFNITAQNALGTEGAFYSAFYNTNDLAFTFLAAPTPPPGFRFFLITP